MKVKSIWVACNNYPYKNDNGTVFVKNIVDAMSRKGIRVTVIAPQRIVQNILRHKEKHPFFRSYVPEGGVEVKVYQPYYITLGNRFPRFNQLSAMWRVYRTAKKLKGSPDVCYGHFWHWGHSWFKYAKENNIPLVVVNGETPISLHKVYPRQKLKEFSDYISGVICNSSYCCQLSLESELTVKEKCCVVPNGIDPSVFYPRNKEQLRKQHGIKESDFVVAFTGWFSNNKGSKRVSYAIEKLNDSSIKSIFIGENPGSDTSEEPTCQGILHMGRIAHDNLPEWLSMADVFVLPTQHEGCNNSIIEALACGVPVISSDRSFNWDILDDSCSIMVDPMNIEAIANAIAVLKKDKELRKKLADGALKKSQELTIDKRAENILKFIESKN